MRPAQLLAHFDRVCEAPGAVPRLRQFVLELAVRGKLVDPDINDKPASDLARIQLEKERRIKHGKLKSAATLPPVTPAEAWFEIPSNWVWVRLGTITHVLMGQSPPGATYNKVGNGLPLINGPVEFTEGPFGRPVVNQYTTEPTNICEEGDLLLCVRGSTTGRTNIAGFRACIGRGVAAIRPLFADEYVRLFVWRLRASIIAMGRGIAFPSVSRLQIELLPVPLPPLAEQQRIVTKVNELMALCDRLEAAQAERERRRDRLVAASLKRLNEPASAGGAREHVRFHLNHLPRLTTRREHIKQLRQTILQLAVRGRLAALHSNDPSGETLLKKILEEKKRLVRANALKSDKSLRENLPTEPPHSVPSNWVWARLQDVFEISRGGSPRPAGDPRYFGGPIPWITVGEITKDTGKYLSSTDTGLTEEGAARSRYINVGDLLLTNSGATLGVPKVSRIRACMNDGVAVLRLFHSTDLNDFAYLYLQSQTDAFRNVNQGMGQPNLNTSIIAGWFFPLPPLPEQHRIVAKVDELMAVCDKLEAQLSATQTESTRLLEATLHQALAVA